MEKRWYSIREAAERLSVSHDTVSRLVERGELPAIRVSKRIVRIPIPAFDFYASGRTPVQRRVVRRRVGELPPIAPGERVGDLEPVQPRLRLTDDGLDTYLASVGDLLDRYGLDVADGASAIDQAPGALRLGVRAMLPGGASTPAMVEIRETWVEDGAGAFERAEYVYELIDRERDFRRGYHLHDRDWFERRFLVVVHEHCERPIGSSACDHYEGTPIRDAFAGILALIDAWTGDPPDCSTLRCLD